MSVEKGLFWCPIRKDYQRWEEHIRFYREMSEEDCKKYDVPYKRKTKSSNTAS